MRSFCFLEPLCSGKHLLNPPIALLHLLISPVIGIRKLDVARGGADDTTVVQEIPKSPREQHEAFVVLV